MPATKICVITLVLLIFVFNSAFAQAQAQTTAVQSGVTITAAATDERVRITAPSSIVQLHVEIYAPSGEKLFDQEIRGGNVFDWHLQDGQAQRLAPGSYICVVTAKSVSGKLTQKIGMVSLEEKAASVQTADSQKLSTLQAQAIGPVEENSSWTVPDKDGPQTATVIASDGAEGQMIRGRGALTFRLGNFFTGTDTEQMRLTETGNLGLGTSQPQAKLDVAGTIRAQRFLVARPNSKGETAQAHDTADAIQPLTSGAGTTDQLTKWTDGSNGVLGDSIITESAGKIGIGTAAPGTRLQISDGPDANLRIGRTGYNIMRLLFDDDSNSRIHAIYDAHDHEFKNGVATLLFVDSGGKVGVGTNSPGALLDVQQGGLGPTAGSGIRVTGTYPNIQLYSRYNGAGNRNWAIVSSFNWGQLEFRVSNALNGDPLDAGTSAMVINRDGLVGIGTTTPTSRLTVAGTIESISGGIKFPDGTTQTTAGGGATAEYRRTETPTVNQTSVGDVGYSPPNVINGFLGNHQDNGQWRGNRVTPGVAGATIGGGGLPGGVFLPNGDWQLGSRVNSVTAWFGTVGGGYGNSAGGIGSGDYAATVAGGSQNSAYGRGATVGGGFQNYVEASHATVAGGYTNFANKDGATIGGGNGNWARGFAATVVGGSDNAADGDWATVGGGAQNNASANYSFAAGSRAKANHQGTFVWADSAGVDFVSTGNNQFLIKASGGVGIGTNAPKTQLQVSGDVYVDIQGKGIILKATDGPGCFRVTVNNAGTLTATSITCP